MLVLLFVLLAAPQAEAPPPPPVLPRAETTYRVPYRLADTQHILVRARINGKGPFTFIMDTGAPEIYFAKDTAAKIGITPDAESTATLDRFEIEGGAVEEKIAARIADPSQLIGMNSLGLNDSKIEGVLGYNVLARYRIDLDLARKRMQWTRLAYVPPPMATAAELTGNKMLKPSANYAAMENMNKSLASLLPKRAPVQVITKGFFGIEFVESAENVQVKAVLPASPAAAAGITRGDVLTQAAVAGKPPVKLARISDAGRLLGDVAPGEAVAFTVARGKQVRTITVTPGKAGL